MDKRQIATYEIACSSLVVSLLPYDWGVRYLDWKVNRKWRWYKEYLIAAELVRRTGQLDPLALKKAFKENGL